MPVTDDIRIIQQKWTTRWGPAPSLGDYVCRTVKGTNKPSQHAWGNAWDVGVAGRDAQEPKVRWLQTLPETGLVLWAGNRPADHSDHIHVEGRTPHRGAPPCMTGQTTTEPKGTVTKLPVPAGSIDPARTGPDQVPAGRGEASIWTVGTQMALGVVAVMLSVTILAANKVGAGTVVAAAKGALDAST